VYETPAAPATPPVEAKKKPLFIIKHGSDAERLARADRVTQVQSYVLQDYEIRRATADEAFALGKQGVEEEAVA